MEGTEKQAANFIEEFIDEDLARRSFRPCAHALPSGAERLSAHRPREGAVHRLRHRPEIRRKVQSPLRRYEPHQGGGRLRRGHSRPTSNGWATKWDELHFASDFFGKLYEIACDMIRRGVAYVDDQTPEEMRVNRGTLTRPGVNSPVSRPLGGGEPRPVRAHEERRVRRGRARAAREDRHGRAERAAARPDDVPHQPPRAPSHGHAVVHLSHVRFPASGAGRDRGRDRIRCARWNTRFTARCTTGSSARQRVTDAAAAPDRVRPPEHRAHRHVQALSAPPGGGKGGQRLGRSPHAHAGGRCAAEAIPPAAIHDFMSRVGVAKSDSEVEGNLLDHCVREALSDAAPRAMAVVDPLKVTLVELGLRIQLDALEVENHPDHPEYGHPHRRPSAASCTSNARTSWRSRSRSSSVWRPARRFA